MAYRTKTYLAAEWDGDNSAITQIKTWNDNTYWSLTFTDAHNLTQARDTSLNCSIKSSLDKRLNVSKKFVLIVGDNTKTVRNGSCQYCSSYNSYNKACDRGVLVDYKSYIEYECAKALRDGLEIVVLYNAAVVNRTKCPDVISTKGTHTAMLYIQDSKRSWNYQAVKEAISI